MALYTTLPVYRDCYSLTLMLFQYTKEFPREYKYTLGQDIKRDSIELVRSIYRANRAENKREYLEKFLDDLELLKFEIRLSVDMHLMSIKQQSQVAELMDSVVCLYPYIVLFLSSLSQECRALIIGQSHLCWLAFLKDRVF